MGWSFTTHKDRLLHVNLAPAVGRLSLSGRYGYVEMMKCLMINLFSFAGYLPVCQYSPFMVVSIEGGESRPVYGGLFTVGGYGEVCFFPAWVAT
jgi:hypothetical protein